MMYNSGVSVGGQTYCSLDNHQLVHRRYAEQGLEIIKTFDGRIISQ